MKNADLPINPIPHRYNGYAGLTKREHFAAMAMQGIIASKGTVLYSQCAEDAVVYADYLLEALEQEEE